MTFSKKIATINLNSIKTDINKSLLRDFIINENLDFVFLQEVLFEDFSFINTHRAFVNISDQDKGTAILIRKNQGFRNVIYDPSGRILSIVCDDVNLINVYAHSGTNKKRERDDLFRNQMTAHIVKGNNLHTIIGGDFNCILNKRDSRSAIANISNGLRDLTKSMHLKDVATELKGSNTEFTFFRSDSASRLDRFYVNSGFLSNVSNVRTVEVAFSDHMAVIMSYKVDPKCLCFRGRGYWKLNASLLKDDEISRKVDDEIGSLRNRLIYTENRSVWWNTALKPKIQYLYKNGSRMLNFRINAEKSSLYNRMNELAAERSRGIDTKNELQIVKSKLMDIEQRRIEYYGSRFSGISMLENEKLSLYHVTNQLHKFSQPSAFQLEIGNELVKETGKLREVIHKYYTDTFCREDVQLNEENTESILNSAGKSLDPQQAESLLRPITEEELKEVIKKTHKRKALDQMNCPMNFTS